MVSAQPVSGIVALDVGFDPAHLQQFFLGYVENSFAIDKKQQRVFCRELNAVLSRLVPLFHAVPLPVQSAGLERGMYGFPEPGTIVELAFAYGLPDRPFIRRVLGEGASLPPVEPGELVHQAAPGVYQRADSAGN